LKRDTGPAILSTSLIKDIPLNQPMMIFTSDHLIDKLSVFNKAINNKKKFLTDKNVFVFGIKPKNPSTEYGYFLSKRIGKLNKVKKFIEKPKLTKAKQIIKNNGYWNSGMFYLRKDSIINNFKKYRPSMYKNCLKAVANSRYSNKVFYLNKTSFSKAAAKSFDYAILEKTNDINAINLDIPWSDLGSWNEISKIFNRDKAKYFKKKNVYYRPWGRYVNLFEGKGFLVKKLYIKSKSSISLQKKHHRSEHWLVTQGKPIIQK
jgi:Mannose-1-phosphate guanylyltransferase